MKNRYIIIVLIAIFFGGISGCSDLLEEDARGLLTPENFFTNEDEANLALNGLHSGVGDAGITEHLGTDAGVTGRFAIAAGWQIAVYNFDVDNAQVRNLWSDSYANIRNANLVLAATEASSLTDEVKGRTTAQALFYRAFNYLRLTYSYGDVPNWRDALVIEEVSLLGQTDADIIQTENIADLEQAISSGFLSTDRWNQNNSRPTVWAARMLKAYYHIWREEWAQARDELIEITANSPHVLSDDYADMYREGNEFNDELIFGREALLGIQNNAVHNQAHFNSNGENEDTRAAMAELDIFARAASLCLRKSFADTYDINDARRPYNVFDRFTLANGTEAVFNWTYLPKLMRASLPLSDPLMQNPEPNNLSSSPRRIFRLSDAYLLLAEAEFMLNGSSSEALAAINMVRGRTSLPLYTSITIEDIRNERGWEMAAEGFWGRKYDLIRWGILASTVQGLPAAETAAGAIPLAIERAQTEADLFAAGQTGQFLVFPIPLDDILKSQDLGGALTQNPLWE